MPNEYTSKMPPRIANCRHVFDHRHAFEADRLEVLGDAGQPVRVALAQLEAKILERARHPRFLQQRARRRDEQPQLAAHQLLERIDALAGDLHVWFGFAEAFARRVQRRPGVASVSVSRSASQRSASATPSAATTKKRVGNRRDSAATSAASAEPGNPPTSKRPPGAGSVLSVL